MEEKDLKSELEFLKSICTDEHIIDEFADAVNLYLGRKKIKKKKGITPQEIAISTFSANFYNIISLKSFYDKLNNLNDKEKRFTRFGYLRDDLIQREGILERLNSEISEPAEIKEYKISYLDEWLNLIKEGEIPLTGEGIFGGTKKVEKEEREAVQKRIKDLSDKTEGLLADEKNLVGEIIETLSACIHSHADLSYDDEIEVIDGIEKKLADWRKIAKEYDNKNNYLIKLTEQMEESGEGAIIIDEEQKRKLAIREIERLQKIIKRPILIDKYLEKREINTKAYVAETIRSIEEVDCTVFLDADGNRDPAKILIVPGTDSMAWPDRLIVSFIAQKNAREAMIQNFAKYRWSKATSFFHWRGIKDNIISEYQELYPDKRFEELKESFFRTYFTWMTTEVNGNQKLKENERAYCWKYIRFPDHIKQKLAIQEPYKGLLEKEKGKRRLY